MRIIIGTDTATQNLISNLSKQITVLQKQVSDLQTALFSKLNIIQIGETNMAKTLADLQADVIAEATVNQSAITLLQGLKAQLDAAIASGDPAQIQAISDSLEANTAALAAAVTANTPAAPASTGGTALDPNQP